MSATLTGPAPTRGEAPSHSPPDTRWVPGIGVTQALGWFSIGLGLAETLAPDAMARLTGVRKPATLWAYGLREIVTGVGILATRGRPTWWMWGRVVGDALDLATIAAEAGDSHDDTPRYERLLASAAAVAGVTVLDVMCALGLSAADRLEG